MTELKKLENYWIAERESVSPLSQDNAKQMNECIVCDSRIFMQFL